MTLGRFNKTCMAIAAAAVSIEVRTGLTTEQALRLGENIASLLPV